MRQGIQERLRYNSSLLRKGSVIDVSIMTPIGLGLDEQAVEAVSGWTFEPGRKAGAPVAVRISTEVRFSLY